MTSTDADGSDQPPQAADVAGELPQDDPETIDPETPDTGSLLLDLQSPVHAQDTTDLASISNEPDDRTIDSHMDVWDKMTPPWIPPLCPVSRHRWKELCMHNGTHHTLHHPNH